MVVTYGTFFHTPMYIRTPVKIFPDAYLRAPSGFRALRYRSIRG